MAAEGDSFLPRILSVFYAVFDDLKGSRIVYQVPEGLIASNTPAPASCVSPGSAPFSLDRNDVNSRGSSASRNSLTQDSCRPRSSPQKRSTSLNTTLFNFEDISRYVIPQSALCGRLVICATRKHRVIGFPVELYGDRYERNYFRYNLSFVFERRADLSCYEPIVRKIGRVLTACEVRGLSLPAKRRSRMPRRNRASCPHQAPLTQSTPFWNSCMRISTHMRRPLFPSTSLILLSSRYSPSIPTRRLCATGWCPWH